MYSILYTIQLRLQLRKTTPRLPYTLPRVVLSLGSDLPVWKLSPDLAVLDLVLGLLVETDTGLLFLEDEVDVWGVLAAALRYGAASIKI